MKKIEKSYKECCMDYVLGFASAFFMSANVMAIVALAGYSPKYNIPVFIHGISIIFFSSFTILGFVLLVIGYDRPVKFYELLKTD